MQDILIAMRGKKTFGLVAVGLFLLAAGFLGWVEIPADQVRSLLDAIILGSIATLRAGVNNAK